MKIKLNEITKLSSSDYIKTKKISNILIKFILSKPNNLYILRKYLWEYRRKIELLHLQLKGNIIKRFCQKILNKQNNNFNNIINILITKIYSFNHKKNGKFFIYHLKHLNNKSRKFYKMLSLIISHKISSKICFYLNILHKEIEKREKKNKLFERTLNIQNSHLKKKLIITSTQQIEEKNAEFEYRKRIFYQNLEKKIDNKEDMKQSKKKFYWRPFQCEKSLNLEKEMSLTKQIYQKKIESGYMDFQQIKDEMTFEKETKSFENNEEIEYFEKAKKFYWLPYHSIESSKELNKLKNVIHKKLELNDSSIENENK